MRVRNIVAARVVGVTRRVLGWGSGKKRRMTPDDPLRQLGGTLLGGTLRRDAVVPPAQARGEAIFRLFSPKTPIENHLSGSS